MKPKSLLVLMTAMLCSAMIAPSTAEVTTIYLDPHTKSGTFAVEPGEEFYVLLNVSAVSDLYLWVVNIEWNSCCLDVVKILEGGCLKFDGTPTTGIMYAEIVHGKIRELTCSRTGMVSGAHVPPAPSDLANITFRVNEACEVCTYIDMSITFSDLLNSEGMSIPHEVARLPEPFHVIPELPAVILGLGAMLGALGVYRYIRKTH